MHQHFVVTLVWPHVDGTMIGVLLQAWIELSTLEGPDYFGEAAMLNRGVRHATVIADSNVEVLVLTKVDFDLKIDREARDVVGILVSSYPKDTCILKCAFCCSFGCCGCTYPGDSVAATVLRVFGAMLNTDRCYVTACTLFYIVCASE